MSSRSLWNLYGRDSTGNKLPSDITDRICEAMEKEVDEWYRGYDDDSSGMICEFMTDRWSGYSTVTELLAEQAKIVPDAYFILECHNTDEDWRQRILYHGEDKEELDGYTAYETPKRILYEAPTPIPRLVIVLDGGSVQGVYTTGGDDADVVTVDLDETKLEGCDAGEKRATQAWIQQQLEECQTMKSLYGGVDAATGR